MLIITSFRPKLKKIALIVFLSFCIILSLHLYIPTIGNNKFSYGKLRSYKYESLKKYFTKQKMGKTTDEVIAENRLTDLEKMFIGEAQVGDLKNLNKEEYKQAIARFKKEMQKMLVNEPKYQNRIERKPDRLELEFYLQYAKDVESGERNDELEPEWQWASDISIVYTWVNGSDPHHLELKSHYNGGIIKADNRDRCIDELRFSMRSLFKNLPWHKGKIFIVTPGQTPVWLDTNHPRIKIIDQADILPKYDMNGNPVSPTFNSFAIEWYFDKIPGLSEQFIQLNDEYFFRRPVHPAFFFYGGGEGYKYKTRIEEYERNKKLNGEKGNTNEYLNRNNNNKYKYDKRSDDNEEQQQQQQQNNEKTEKVEKLKFDNSSSGKEEEYNEDEAIERFFGEVLEKRTMDYYDNENFDWQDEEINIEKEIEMETNTNTNTNNNSTESNNNNNNRISKRDNTIGQKKEFIQRYIYPNAAQHYRFPNIYLSKQFLGKGFNHARDIARRPFSDTTWIQKFAGALAMTNGCIKEIMGKTTLINMLEHAPYVWYRDIYSLTRKKFEKYVNMTLTHKFRNPLDFIPPYANQFYMRFYASKEGFEEEVFDKAYGTKYIYDVDENDDPNQPTRSILKYGFHVVDNYLRDKILKFGAIFDDPERNKKFYKFIIESNTLLFFNLNDDYTELEAGDQLHEFMEFLYPDPGEFEKNYKN